MFTAPPEATLEWNDAAVEGSYRFLRRVWNFGVRLAVAQKHSPNAAFHGLKAVFGKEAKALRLEGAQRAQAGGLRLPAHAVQHRGLRRDEDAQRAGRLQGPGAG